MAVANSLAYYIMAIITAVKSFIVQALGESFKISRAINHVVIMFIVQATGHSAMVINDATRGIMYNMPHVLGFSSTCHVFNQ